MGVLTIVFDIPEKKADIMLSCIVAGFVMGVVDGCQRNLWWLQSTVKYGKHLGEI